VKTRSKLDRVYEFTFKKTLLFLILGYSFWPIFFKTLFFFQARGTEIKVEVTSSHVFSSNIENLLSPQEELKLEMKTPMIMMF